MAQGAEIVERTEKGHTICSPWNWIREKFQVFQVPEYWNFCIYKKKLVFPFLCINIIYWKYIWKKGSSYS